MSAITGAWDQFVGYFRQLVESLAGFYDFAGGHRWALAIITLVLIVKTLLIPLAIKQVKSMQANQRLQPEMQRLRQKYKSDRQKLGQEMQELYRREGVNPYASCLPMLPQAPVFMAIFYTIRDLSARLPDGSMPFLGLGDLTRPASSQAAGWLLIVIMVAAQFLTTRQLNVGGTPQQKRLQQLMPLIFVFIMIGFPTGLVLYWTAQNLYQLVQQMIMLKGIKPPEPPTKAELKAEREQKAQQEAPKKVVEGKAKKAPASPPVSAPLGTPPPGSYGDAAAARRELAEKRRRRRRRKKKRKR